MNEQELIWAAYARKHGYCLILVLKDLEDRDIYPVYFDNEQSLFNYQNNIISESKVKIVKVLYL